MSVAARVPLSHTVLPSARTLLCDDFVNKARVAIIAGRTERLRRNRQRARAQANATAPHLHQVPLSLGSVPGYTARGEPQWPLLRRRPQRTHPASTHAMVCREALGPQQRPWSVGSPFQFWEAGRRPCWRGDLEAWPARQRPRLADRRRSSCRSQPAIPNGFDARSAATSSRSG